MLKKGNVALYTFCHFEVSAVKKNEEELRAKIDFSDKNIFIPMLSYCALFIIIRRKSWQVAIGAPCLERVENCSSCRRNFIFLRQKNEVKTHTKRKKMLLPCSVTFSCNVYSDLKAK